jgi:hypothetical protein
MEKNVWYSRISFSTLFRALRMDPEYTVRLISRYWFPYNSGSTFVSRVKEEYKRNVDFVTWFKNWFEDEFCSGLLKGEVLIEDATRNSYLIACQFLKKKAAVAYINPIRDLKRITVYFARHDVKSDLEKVAAAAKSIDDVCQLFAAYHLYPPPQRSKVAVMKRLCLRCGQNYLALMRPPSIDLITELYLAYPRYFYIDERLLPQIST